MLYNQSTVLLMLLIVLAQNVECCRRSLANIRRTVNTFQGLCTILGNTFDARAEQSVHASGMTNLPAKPPLRSSDTQDTPTAGYAYKLRLRRECRPCVQFVAVRDWLEGGKAAHACKSNQPMNLNKPAGTGLAWLVRTARLGSEKGQKTVRLWLFCALAVGR